MLNQSDTICYTLHHWRLVCIEDMIAATGNLHGRPGYPEGIEIRTSVIRSWELIDDAVLLHTTNSAYLCPLAEYVFSGNTLPMLKAVPFRPGPAEKELNRERGSSGNDT